MRQITIEVLNDAVLKLLRQLEELKLIRLVKSGNEPKKDRRNWVGSISKETAKRMLQEVEESRNKWERGF